MSGYINKILVGTDLSEGAERALDAAVRLAGQLSASIDLVYVLPVVPAFVPDPMVGMPAGADEIAAAQEELAAIIRRHPGATIRSHVMSGDPVAGLLLAARKAQPDMIIVGSHGRGMILRALLGSVAEQICRQSPVPVLVIPAHGRAAAAETAAPPAA